MFCANIASWHDSTDDVLLTHCIVVWFYWWCSVHTSHHGVILLMMFCSHIASLYDSTDDVLYTHRTGFMIPRMMFSAHITSYYDSTDDVLGSLPTGLTIQQMITTRTMYQGYDSRKEFICSLGIRVMIPQMILCVHITLQPMIQRSFYVVKISLDLGDIVHVGRRFYVYIASSKHEGDWENSRLESYANPRRSRGFA